MKSSFAKEKWKALIQEFESSGESRNHFCEVRNLNIKTFGYWIARLGTNSKSKFKLHEVNENKHVKMKTVNKKPLQHPEWIEIKMQDSNTLNVEEPYYINTFTAKFPIKVKIGKAEIHIEPGFDKILFTDIAKILGEIC